MKVYERIKYDYFKIEYLLRTKRISKETADKMKIDIKKWTNDVAEVQKRSRRRKTLRDNIHYKKLTHYVTFTLKAEKQEINQKLVKQSITKMLRRYGIQYILVPEFHQSGAIHFHGFIDIPDYSLIQRKIIDGKPISNKYGDDVMELIPLEKNFGFTDLIDITKKDEQQVSRMINYIIKYLTKENNKFMSSRLTKDITELAIHYFGVDNVEVI